MDRISIVVPCYNEEEAIPIYYNELNRVMSEMPQVQFEVIFVDDGSRDKTYREIVELSRQDNRIYYISFSRNFGKEAAMLAGMEYATGDYVVISDVDLQDPPSIIPQFYDIIKRESCGCVAAYRSTREGEPPVRSAFAHMFYRIFNRLCHLNLADGARDYRIMSRRMVNSIINMSEHNRFSKGAFSWVGFETKWISYENVERSAGITKWSFWKLLKYAFDGFVSYSNFPLHLPFYLSVAAVIAAIFFGIFAVPAVKFNAVFGLIMSALTFSCIGINGIYISRINDESKNRPKYIIGNTNFDERR